MGCIYLLYYKALGILTVWRYFWSLERDTLMVDISSDSGLSVDYHEIVLKIWSGPQHRHQRPFFLLGRILQSGADSAIWGGFCNLRGGFYNLNIGQKECFTDCRICPKRLHNSPLRLHNPPYRLHNPPLRLQIPPLPADCIIRPFSKDNFQIAYFALKDCKIRP